MHKTTKIALCICYYTIAMTALVVAAIVIKPAVGTDLLRNGGFETGNLANWQITSTGDRIGTATIVSPGHSGNYALKYDIAATGAG